MDINLANWCQRLCSLLYRYVVRRAAARQEGPSIDSAVYHPASHRSPPHYLDFRERNRRLRPYLSATDIRSPGDDRYFGVHPGYPFDFFDMGVYREFHVRHR
jgi:hypothetical protein